MDRLVVLELLVTQVVMAELGGLVQQEKEALLE
jgi:hypothetical protein